MDEDEQIDMNVLLNDLNPGGEILSLAVIDSNSISRIIAPD